MKIPVGSKGIKFSFLLISILFLSLFIVCLFDLIRENFFINWIFFSLSSILFIVSVLSTIIFFANYEVNNIGITFKSLIYKKSRKWSDFKFISKYHIYILSQNTFEPVEGFICSYNLEKDKLKRIHSTIYSINYFNVPYSVELEKYVIKNASDIYAGLLIDDSKSE